MVSSGLKANFKIFTLLSVLTGLFMGAGLLIGQSLGVVARESSSSAITYTGEWNDLEPFLDSFLLEEGEEDLDFIYDQMTDGDYTSSEELMGEYDFVREVGEIDLRRGQK